MKQAILLTKLSRRSLYFLLLSTSLVLVGGCIGWFSLAQQERATQASGTILGGPSLSASTVDHVFAQAGSPMQGNGAVIEAASRRTNIDDAFALAVWWSETNDGEAGVGLSYRNPGGVRGSPAYAQGGGGYTIYPTYAAAINDWFNIVQSRYVSRGITSIYTICYPYVGTSGAATWAGKVTRLMANYHAEAPAPSPTPTKPSGIALFKAKPHLLAGGDTGGVNKAGKPKTVANVPVPRQPISAPAAPAKNVSVQSTHVVGRASSSPWPIVLPGLLVAMVLAAWGIRMRRSDVVVSIAPDFPATEELFVTTSPMVAMPPLFVNQYSPVLENHASYVNQYSPVLGNRSSGLMSFAYREGDVEQLAFPASPFANFFIEGEQEQSGSTTMENVSVTDQFSLKEASVGDTLEVTTDEHIAWGSPALSLPAQVSSNGMVGRPMMAIPASSDGGGLMQRYGNGKQ